MQAMLGCRGILCMQWEGTEGLHSEESQGLTSFMRFSGCSMDDRAEQ